MLIDKNTLNQLENFNKYAKFISDQFGVTVVFDGVKACTDGKTIYLPSLKSMNKDEVDFLYGVLLHEVGHIRHSIFTPESFAKIKTQAHFHIANSLEDARIENLLMKEFGGAHDIFAELYGRFSSDEKFMKRVFNISKKQMSLWDAVGIYCHDYYINLQNKKPIEQIVTKKITSQLIEFVEETNLNKLLDSYELKNWDEVVELSNKIYNLFFKNEKDLSLKLDIQSMVNTKDSITNDKIPQLEKEISEIVKRINELQKQMKPIQEKVNSQKTQIKSTLEQITKEKEQVDEKISKIETFTESKEDLEYNSEKISKLDEKINQLQAKKDEFLKNKADIENQIKEQLEKELSKKYKDKETEENSEKNLSPEEYSKKLQGLINKLKNLEEKQKKADEKIAKEQPKKEEKLKEANEAKQTLDKLAPEFSSLTQEQLEQMYNENNGKWRELNSKLNELKAKTPEEQQLSNLRNEIKQLKQELMNITKENLKEMKDSLEKSSIPVDVLPKFEENEAWKESDVVQKSFDEKASQLSDDIVNNGCGLGLTSVRDVITYIENVKNDIVDFNVAEHFHETYHESKLNSLNDIDSLFNNTKDYENSDVVEKVKKHIPISVKFDKVITKNNSDGKDIASMKNKLSVDIKKIKQLFRNHLKFDKKDHYKGNQEEGKIDSRNLWKLATKTDDLYYEVNQPKPVNKVTASIAIDISGSMDKSNTDYGNKLKELTLLLSEGLNEVHIKHEIAGYHAPVNHELRSLGASPLYNRNSNNLETVVFKGFNDKKNNGIANLNLECSDNSDGESLKVIAKRLLQNRSKRKVLFVLTDGKPFLSDADIGVLDNDLKQAILWCKNNKIEVFAFGFNEQGKEFYGDRFCLVKEYQDVMNFIKSKM